MKRWREDTQTHGMRVPACQRPSPLPTLPQEGCQREGREDLGPPRAKDGARSLGGPCGEGRTAGDTWFAGSYRARTAGPVSGLGSKRVQTVMTLLV